MKVAWPPLAREQVVQAFVTIAAERPPAAHGWLDEVVHKAASVLPTTNWEVEPQAREPGGPRVLPSGMI